MLTPTERRIDDSTVELDRGFVLGLPVWLGSYPEIWQKIVEVDTAHRETIALFGTGAGAEPPDPTLLLNRLQDGLFPNFRGLVGDAYRRRVQPAIVAADAMAAAELEVRRALDFLDRWRDDTLRQLQKAARGFRWFIETLLQEAVRSNPDAFLDMLDDRLSNLQSAQRAIRERVELVAKIVEDWIVTVRSVTFPGTAERQQARANLLAQLRVEFLLGNSAGIEVRGRIDDAITAALRAGDVVVMGDSFDPATRRYLASRMAMLAEENVGALLVQVPRDVQPILKQFEQHRDKDQLHRDLRSAGAVVDDAFADMVVAAADHDIRVVAFDTRLGQPTEGLSEDGISRRLQIANPYMAAVLNETLKALPDNEKNVVALVAWRYTNSDGGVDDLTGGISFDRQRVGPPGLTLAPGDVIYPQPNAVDDSTFVFEPPRWPASSSGP